MPRPALISRAVILDETLALADERGLAAVSMRTVAARLGVTAMSLYHHVRDKNDLLDGLVERLLAELSLPDPSLPGEERLHTLARSMRQSAARHPDAFPLLLGRPVATSAALAVRDVAYAALRDAGVPGRARAQGGAAAEHVRDWVRRLRGRRALRRPRPGGSRRRL